MPPISSRQLIAQFRVLLDSFDDPAVWSAVNADTTGLAQSSTHVEGAHSILVNKSGTATTKMGIGLVLEEPINLEEFENGLVQLRCNLPSTTGISDIYVLLGDNAGNTNEYLNSSPSSGWNKVQTNIDTFTKIGNGCDFFNVSYVEVGLIFVSTSDVISGVLFDSVEVIAPVS